MAVFPMTNTAESDSNLEPSDLLGEWVFEGVLAEEQHMPDGQDGKDAREYGEKATADVGGVLQYVTVPTMDGKWYKAVPFFAPEAVTGIEYDDDGETRSASAEEVSACLKQAREFPAVELSVETDYWENSVTVTVSLR